HDAVGSDAGQGVERRADRILIVAARHGDGSSNLAIIALAVFVGVEPEREGAAAGLEEQLLDLVVRAVALRLRAGNDLAGDVESHAKLELAGRADAEVAGTAEANEAGDGLKRRRQTELRQVEAERPRQVDAEREVEVEA